MAEIHDRESLELWLTDQPSGVAVIIAARAALRVLPLLISGRERSDDAAGGAVLLACLRAVASAWTASSWPIPSTGIKSYREAARAASVVAEEASYVIADAVASAAASAAFAACIAASDMEDYRAFAAAVEATDVAAAAAGVAANYAGSEAYAAVNFDAEAIGRGEDARHLARAQLWPGDIPPVIQRRWENFIHGKPKIVDDQWEVWIDWYRDRLMGIAGAQPVIEGLEIARVMIPNEDWEQGPAHVNSLIQRLEDEYRRVDPARVGGQELIGTLFGDDGSAIDVSFDPLQQRPTSSQVAEDFHASLREALEALIAATDIPGQISNRFTDVTSLSRRLLEALGSGPASVRPAQTVACAGRLDRAAQADDRRRDDPDLEGPALSADEREALDNAVDAAKTYINTDPILGPMEQARLGKAQIPIDDALARNVVDAAANEGAATEDAREAVEDAAEAGPEGTKSRFYGATVLNFMRAALRIGAKYSFAAKAGVSVARWLVKHKAKILTLLEPWPDLRNVAERIIAVLEKLPLD